MPRGRAARPASRPATTSMRSRWKNTLITPWPWSSSSVSPVSGSWRGQQHRARGGRLHQRARRHRVVHAAVVLAVDRVRHRSPPATPPDVGAWARRSCSRAAQSTGGVKGPPTAARASSVRSRSCTCRPSRTTPGCSSSARFTSGIDRRCGRGSRAGATATGNRDAPAAAARADLDAQRVVARRPASAGIGTSAAQARARLEENGHAPPVEHRGQVGRRAAAASVTCTTNRPPG